MAVGAREHPEWHKLKGRLKRAVGWLTADRHVEAAGLAEARTARAVDDVDIAHAERKVKARYETVTPGQEALMKQTIRDVMTPEPHTVQATTSLADAAAIMRDGDVGDVIVLTDGQMCGIVTDRDIAVRAVAEGRDPKKTPVAEICSRELVALSPDDSVEDAIGMMREMAIRRLPVVDAGHPVGIVSLGDLAVARDPDSALADISAASPNV